MAHDGSEGVSPGGWLPDRVSVGALTRTFPPELVDRVVEVTDTREVRRRLLPAPLVVYFVLALWLFRGRNCGYGRVMSKLVDGLYHRRRGRQLLDGVLDPAGWVDAGQGRRWRPPNISSLSRARARLGADPLHMLFEQVAGPVGGSVEGSAGDPVPGVFCCGLRVVSMDGSTSDVRATAENSEYFSRPSNGCRAGAFPQVRWLAAAESGTGALIGASFGPYTVGEQTLARDLAALSDLPLRPPDEFSRGPLRAASGFGGSQPCPASERCSRSAPIGEDDSVAVQQPTRSDQLSVVLLAREREPRRERLAPQDESGVPHGRAALPRCPAVASGRGHAPQPAVPLRQGIPRRSWHAL